MAVAYLDFYEPDGTTLIGTLDDEQHLHECEVRPALWELGAGRFVVNRHVAAASSAMLQKGNIVKYRVPLIRSTAIWGFVLQDGDFQLVSRREEGGEYLTFSGPGLLHLLSHARLHWQVYAPGQPNRGDAPDVPDMWRWRNQAWGEILVRGIEEGQNSPDAPLGAISIDFDRDEDSAGVNWAAVTGEFQTPIGTDILTLADRLAMGGNLVLSFDAETMTLSAYQSYGADLTGAFGASTVRFEKGTNAMTELRRQSKTAPVTHMITKDKAGDYALHEATGWSGQAVYGYMEVGQTDDPALVEDIAQQQMSASLLNAEEYELEFPPGESAATGRYLPGPGTAATPDNFWLGAMVTVHTGSGEHDLNNAALRVVALRYVSDIASSDASNDTRARSLRIVAELSFRAIGFGFGATTPPTAIGQPGFCCGPPPGTPTTPPGVDTIPVQWHFAASGEDDAGGGYFWRKSAMADAWNAGGWAAAGGGVLAADNYPWNPGVPIRITASQRNRWPLAFAPGVQLRLSFLNGGGGTISVHWGPVVSVQNVWTPVLIDTVVAPALTTHIKLDVKQAVQSGSNHLANDIDSVVVTIPGSGAAGDPGDGHPDLLGSSRTYAAVDHEHLYIGDRLPTANDDIDAGFDRDTMWYFDQRLWVSTDHTAGAAVWEEHLCPTQAHLHAASDVEYDPTASGLVATDVQAALDEIVATGTTVADLDDLSDVVIASPAIGEVLTYDGSQWENAPAAGGGGGNPLSIVQIYRSTNQNVSGSGALTSISFDTEIEDTDTLWAIGNPTQIVVPAGLNGRRAIVSGGVVWTTSTAGNYRNLLILRAGSQLARVLEYGVGSALGVALQVRSQVLVLSTGDIFELQIRADATGIGAIGGQSSCHFGLYTVD